GDCQYNLHSLPTANIFSHRCPMKSPYSSRRRVLKSGTLAAATLLSAGSWSRIYGANEKLRLAAIGCGGKGRSDLSETAKSPYVAVAALCDIDDRSEHLGWAAQKFPSAQPFSDLPQLLDQGKEFDAVTVSRPDHMHAPIAMPMMQLGKHVHCQKPLTHTVFEARQMRQAAKKYGVVTQMGNQIQSDTAYRTAVKLVHDGVIGKV